MARGFLILATVGFFLLSGYGCGIKAHTYVAERERVDQANTGNAGFIKGEGSSMAGRPTRKVYVVEFEREKKDVKKNTVNPAPVPKTDSAVTTQEQPTESSSVEPSSPVVTPAAAPAPDSADLLKVTEYKVEKDDTLQKISKKVYGTFGKWTKIYDANKEKIKNPNFVKPGTVLTIPRE
jgi:nucleoid-associated protein YgaU